MVIKVTQIELSLLFKFYEKKYEVILYFLKIGDKTVTEPYEQICRGAIKIFIGGFYEKNFEKGLKIYEQMLF